MSTAATKAKQKYNAKTYKRFDVRVKPDLFERLDKYCKNNNLSRSEFLAQAIDLLEAQKKVNSCINNS